MWDDSFDWVRFSDDREDGYFDDRIPYNELVKALSNSDFGESLLKQLKNEYSKRNK